MNKGQIMQKRIVTQLEMSKPPNNNGKPIIQAIAGSNSKPIIKPDVKLLTENSQVSVTGKLARHLQIPDGPYLLYHVDQQGLYLGPVIGILNSSLRAEGRPGPYEAKIYREIVKYARKRGVLIYLFRAGAAFKKEGLIEGSTLNQSGNWVVRQFPRPDIVYNRIRRRYLENSPEVEALLKHIEADPQIYLFNSRFLYKWEVYQAVSSVPMVYNFFPLTMNFNRKNLELMLNYCDEIMLKPDNGSLGKGILKIVAQGDRYTLAQSSDPTHPYKYSSLDKLFTTLKDKMNVNDSTLLQRRVELSRYKGSIFDVRAQFQKDGSGTWVTTGAAVRVASKKQFVTHIPNGGRAEKLEDVTRRIFPKPATRSFIRDQLDFICNHVPSLLEKRLGLNLAIVSMDIAIDPQGKMWILEVNSKPSHFDEPDIRRRHTQLLIDYCIYAATAQKKKLTERSSL